MSRPAVTEHGCEICRTLTTAAWFGVVAGLTEASVLVVSARVSGEPRWAYSPDVLWIAPVTMAFILAIVATTTALVRLVRPDWMPLRLQHLAIVTVAVYPVLRVAVPGLFGWAAALLALGVGVRGSDWLRGHPDAWKRVVRRTLPPAAVGVAMVFAVFTGRPRWVEANTLDALPTASADAPNVLLLILDTVRDRNLGLYGYDRATTPELTSFARGGVTFERAVAPSSWTLPTHATLFTGTWPWEHEADWARGLDELDPTLAEAFSDRGYVTGGFVGNLYYASQRTGLDRGFLHYDDRPRWTERMVEQSWLAGAIVRRINRLRGEYDLLARRTAAELNDATLSWIDRRADRPFFVFINYYDAHGPYLPPVSTDRFGPIDERGWLADGEPPSAEAAARLLPGYDASIHYLDARIGELLDALEERGALDNTIVVVTSDHGEEFFEHGLLDHGNSLYLQALGVPLVVRYPPAVPAGRRVAEAVSLRDVPRTIVELAGLGDDDGLPGTSLAPLWSDASAPWTDPVLASLSAKPWDVQSWYPLREGSQRSIVVEGQHLIVSSDGFVELYDIVADPDEQMNLAELPAYRGRVAELTTRLDAAVPAAYPPD